MMLMIFFFFFQISPLNCEDDNEMDFCFQISKQGEKEGKELSVRVCLDISHDSSGGSQIIGKIGC